MPDGHLKFIYTAPGIYRKGAKLTPCSSFRDGGWPAADTSRHGRKTPHEGKTKENQRSSPKGHSHIRMGMARACCPSFAGFYRYSGSVRTECHRATDCDLC